MDLLIDLQQCFIIIISFGLLLPCLILNFVVFYCYAIRLQ